MADEPDYSLALEEARRSTDALSEELPALRNRATQLLSVSGLSAAFLGGLAFDAGDRAALGPWGWVALGLFVVTIGLCIALLWPRRFYMSVDPGKLVTWAKTPGISDSTMRGDLAQHMGEKYESNRSQLDSLSTLYTCAIVALVLQIIAFVVNVVWR